MVQGGHYFFTTHLMALDSCRPVQTRGYAAAYSQCANTGSPLIISQWTEMLRDHPDKSYAQYIIKGIQEGFRIGFSRHHYCCPATTNLPSQVPEIIQEHLQTETDLGRMHCLPRGSEAKGIQMSPIGAIPKKNKPGKWRLITDLSSPLGASVNDGISKEYSSVRYTSVDHLASLIITEGRGALLVKADIKEAYRMVPVHPSDQLLLGIGWNDRIYIDKMLPFGLRSAPIIFSAVADALQWILIKQGIPKLLHYLDDFILIAKVPAIAENQKQILISTCKRLGVPLEPSKLEGPTTCLTFLGIEIDTVALQIRLPEEKLATLRRELTGVLSRKVISKKALQSITGLLQFASKVVRPGRPFLRRLYALQEVGSHPMHHIRLNNAARADILWWHLFVEKWNGTSMLWDFQKHSPDITVFSDASGSWGCGALWQLNWFNLPWSVHLQDCSIAVKEFIPVVIAAALYGPQWKGKIVQFVVDNIAVVEILNSTYCKDSHLMHLIRLLVFLASFHNFWFTARHIAGRENILADALSRNNMSFFHSQVPQAPQDQPRIPEPLINLLAQNLSWISIAWIQQFSIITQLH